jgi:translation initiation factor eIF-2B subunit gamma
MRNLLIVVLDPPRRDPLSAALSRSTSSRAPPLEDLSYSSPASSTSSDHMVLPTAPASPSQGEELLAFKDAVSQGQHTARRAGGKYRQQWKCQVIVVAPEPVEPMATKSNAKSKIIPVEPDYLIRANTVAGYWELNRRFVRSLANMTGPPATPRNANSSNSDDTTPLISSSSQISPDSLLGQGSKVNDRASIKKCVVGRHCVIGPGAKLTGCVLWDFVIVEAK